MTNGADTTPQQQPVLIPVHGTGQIPEWAMLEVNGELIWPKESPDGQENETLVDAPQMELGSLDFIDNVRSFVADTVRCRY